MVVAAVAAATLVGLRWRVDMLGLRHSYTASISSWHWLRTPCDSDKRGREEAGRTCDGGRGGRGS